MRGRISPRQRLAQGLDDFREYERIAGFWEIARRALANNAFDGILTTIGVLMGSYVAGVRSAAVASRQRNDRSFVPSRPCSGPPSDPATPRRWLGSTWSETGCATRSCPGNGRSGP